MQVESKSPEPKKMRVAQCAVKFFPAHVTPGLQGAAVSRPPFIIERRLGSRRSLICWAKIAIHFPRRRVSTTAMSLRLLERCTRFWGAQAGSLRSPEPERTLLDLGTGTGILALAAARFGAKRVIAIDHDPVAIATARENARRNKLDNIDFRVADVRRRPFPPRIEIITANLFSELLIEIVPKLKRAQRLILSGILREQEAQLVRALKRNGIVIVEMRRRGKWIAILARG